MWFRSVQAPAMQEISIFLTIETFHNVYITKKQLSWFDLGFFCSLFCRRRSNMDTRSCSGSQTHGGGISLESW